MFCSSCNGPTCAIQLRHFDLVKSHVTLTAPKPFQFTFTYDGCVVQVINVREHEVRDLLPLLHRFHQLRPRPLLPRGDDLVRVKQRDPLVRVEQVVEAGVVGL